MASATTDKPDVMQQPRSGEHAERGGRQVAHLSHDFRQLTAEAEEAIEDGIYAARRAIKSARRRVDDLGDLRDDAIHGMKRQPVKAAGIVLGAGLVSGIVLGWMAGRWATNSRNRL
jgi:hypothetical protein